MRCDSRGDLLAVTSAAHGAEAVSGRLRADLPAGRYDAGLRRKSSRKGRERGCSLYIAAEELAAAGIDLEAAPPLYRVWSGRKGSLLVQLYPAPATPADEDGGSRG